MFGARTLNCHAAMMNRMAETLGVDLTEALKHGQFTSEGWRDAVESCACCEDPAACLHWLADHDPDADLTQQTDSAPDYCNNRQLMARLKAALHAEQAHRAEQGA